MGDFLFYLFLLALLALMVVAGVWLVRSYLAGVSPVASIFGPRPERRLAIVEQAAVDSRRRLVLLRRDNVEHLIMTGGPVDVVIETGIPERRSHVPQGSEADLNPPVFSRPPRSLGQTGTDAAE
jgi:flagellar protein FliO/FliZ